MEIFTKMATWHGTGGMQLPLGFFPSSFIHRYGAFIKNMLILDDSILKARSIRDPCTHGHF
jgi:hypothetical protein